MAYGFGGAEQTTANLLSHLDRTRIKRITLAAPAVLRPYLPGTYDTFVDVSALGLHGGFTTPADLYRQARITGGLLRTAMPDVTIGMMHYASALVALGVWLVGVRTRVVVSYRGPFYEYMRHHEQGVRRKLFLWAVVAGAARLAERVIVPSRGTAEELRRRFLIPASRIGVIPNGIDLAAADSAAHASMPDLADFETSTTPVLCAVARLAPEKDLGLLLEAFRRVRIMRPAILLVLGDGPEREAMEALIAAGGLADSVRLIGYRANVMPYLRRADIFIHTCLFEGFGYTLLEALACRTAVVSTDCPYGPREVLAGGEYGLLVPPADPQVLADAILKLLDDPAGCRALADKGLQRAKQLCVRRMAEAYEHEFLALACA